MVQPSDVFNKESVEAFCPKSHEKKTSQRRNLEERAQERKIGHNLSVRKSEEVTTRKKKKKKKIRNGLTKRKRGEKPPRGFLNRQGVATHIISSGLGGGC